MLLLFKVLIFLNYAIALCYGCRFADRRNQSHLSFHNLKLHFLDKNSFKKRTTVGHKNGSQDVKRSESKKQHMQPFCNIEMALCDLKGHTSLKKILIMLVLVIHRNFYQNGMVIECNRKKFTKRASYHF